MKRISILLLAAMLAGPACSNEIAPPGGDDDTGGNDPGGDDSGNGNGSQDEWDHILSTRVTDYSAALKIAALRLTGSIPSMTEINQVAGAPDDTAKRAAYETLLRDYMNRPTFARQVFFFWQDTFKTGGSPVLDTAAAFAAKLAVDNGSYMDLFTKASANCPTFDQTTGVFTAAECTNGGPQVGVLTNPGLMQQFFSNFAFRRVRFVQETFDCTRFPVEQTTTPIDVGGASPYRNKWPFDSISSPRNAGGRIDFQDNTAVICANCHATMNHIAPLFAYYNDKGAYQPTISVPTPLEGTPAPLAKLSDYTPPTETTAWRYGVPTPNLPAFGAAMAADPEIAKCGVARMWNWALGKTDIVDTLQEVPLPTIQAQLDAFTQNGFKMKDLIFAMYASDDFVKF